MGVVWGAPESLKKLWEKTDLSLTISGKNGKLREIPEKKKKGRRWYPEKLNCNANVKDINFRSRGESGVFQGTASVRARTQVRGGAVHAYRPRYLVRGGQALEFKSEHVLKQRGSRDAPSNSTSSYETAKGAKKKD